MILYSFIFILIKTVNPFIELWILKLNFNLSKVKKTNKQKDSVSGDQTVIRFQ